MSGPGKRIYEFDTFRLDSEERLFLRDGQHIPLTPKVFDTLMLLVQNSGHLLLKDQMMKALWPDSFVEEANLSQNVSILRRVLGEKPNQQRYIATVPGKGYRFVAAVRELGEVPKGDTEDGLASSIYSCSRVAVQPADNHRNGDAAAAASVVQIPWRRVWMLKIAGAALLVALGGLVLYRMFRTEWQARLRRFDPVVVVDFSNNTGDQVFDDTLKQALIVDLEQSPFLSLLSDVKVAQALRMMERSPYQPLTAEVARDLCQRVGGKAVITGTIRQIGSEYVIGLGTSNCQTGDSLGDEQARANGKEQVLQALDDAAAKLRAKLGESLASVQKYDTPVEQATTPSLVALQAYSAALRVQNTGGHAAAIPLFKRAIELDPNFAMAYSRLGNAYANLGETRLATENASRAFALGDHASQREKLYIEAHYDVFATGDLEAANQVHQEWLEIYPRDDVALGNLSVNYGLFGDHDKALAYARQGLEAAPNEAAAYVDVAQALLALDRLDEAEAALQQMQNQHLYMEESSLLQYQIAFLKGDTARLSALAADALRMPGDAGVGLLPAQSDTEAYYGRMQKARELNRRAIQAILRLGAKETAATWEADAALREAELGNHRLARRHAAVALAMARTRSVEALAALALARARASSQAQELAADLNRQFPSDTLLNDYWLPSINAAIELGRGRPAQALEELEPAARYELGATSPVPSAILYPVYLRASALLASGKFNQAAAEFQKVLAHRSLAVNSLLVPMSHFGLARSYAMEGDSSKARSAYLDFFRLWQQADTDLPILQEAKLGYTQLK